MDVEGGRPVVIGFVCAGDAPHVLAVEGVGRVLVVLIFGPEYLEGVPVVGLHPLQEYEARLSRARRLRRPLHPGGGNCRFAVLQGRKFTAAVPGGPDSESSETLFADFYNPWQS